VRNEELLPLFPLHTVLFPDSALPLHIFEDRYKILINKSITEKSGFGINLVEGTAITSVGCSAMVRDVVRRYEDGRMDIVVEGRRRYRIRRYTQEASPYLMGVVSYLENGGEQPDGSLVSETISLFNKLVGIVYKDNRFRVSADSSTGELSFRLAQKAGMEISQRQRFLEQDSENTRLEMFRRYLKDVLPKVERVEEIDRIIGSDGYL